MNSNQSKSTMKVDFQPMNDLMYSDWWSISVEFGLQDWMKLSCYQ